MKIKGEFNFNMHQSWRYRGQYERAYAATNEPLSWELRLAEPKDKNVLTVAASGDQPLLYAAYGASRVDTFDLTYYARVLMDFKTTALRGMEYEEYCTVVRDMSFGPACMHAPNVKHTIRQMPAQTGTLMQKCIGRKNWAFDRQHCYFIDTPYNPEEYALMQTNITRPFDFVWTDLAHLHNYLDARYDIINLSNIFDHFQFQKKPTGQTLTTLQNLWPYLNDGGKILCMTANIASEMNLRRELDIHLNHDGRAANISAFYANNELYTCIMIQKIH